MRPMWRIFSTTCRLRSFAAGIVFFAVLFPTLSQTPQTGAFRITEIKFTGLKRYTDAQASHGTGLKVGNMAGTAQLADAANKLTQSGAFDNVSYSYRTRGDEIAVEFQVKETQSVLPCVFDNFVWFSHDEIDHTLRDRVPFYSGTAPERGATLKEISNALEALLHANGINGSVEGIPYIKQLGGPVSAIAFKVDGVPLPITSLRFPGASAVTEKQLVAASTQITRHDFSETDIKVFLSSGLLPLYLQRGYLRAEFTNPQATISTGSKNGAATAVDVIVPVMEGNQYMWEKALWSGNQQIPAADLDGILGMKPREVANQEKIDSGVDAIRKSYSAKGYIDAQINAKPTLDDTTLLADFQFTIMEGAEYHMGQLFLAGFSNRDSKDLSKKWRLKPGDVFDGTYPEEYLKKILFPSISHVGGTPITSNLALKRDSQNSTVDVEITLH